jgi:hypothetical protein
MKFLQVLLVLAGTALFFVSEAQNGPERREWTLKPSDDADLVQFGIDYRTGNRRSSHHSPIPWTSIRGLNKDQAAKLSAPAKFEVVRDPGKLLCEGTFHLGRGIGTFTFQADPAYKAELEKLGFRLADSHKELDYFLANVSLDFARVVKDADLKASSDDLFDMRIHGLTKDYIREMRASGYTNLNARDYIDLKIHGVTTEFVRDLKAAGYDVAAQKIVQLRIHGVDTPFMADLKKAGYNLNIDKIVEMKIHGISRSYIQALNSYGLKPNADDLVQMKIHGVEPEFLKGLKDAGLQDLDSENVVQLRTHGVSTDFIQRSRDMGYKFNANELRELRVHGVDSAYLRKLKDSGFQNLTADKIVQLRVHGVD